MTAFVPVAGPSWAAGEAAWRIHLSILAAAATLVLVLLRQDVADMVRIWLDSSTFNHCALITPIIAWLVWQRLPQLRQLSPSAWSPGLIVIAAGAALWVLGWAGSIGLARHLALVVILQGLVITCLGRVVALGLAFPLFYAIFLVPAGEELVPLMQTVTAQICMVLLGLVGIPAHLEGVFITTPSGYFEVAEACSGVKFLVAMVAYGALVANVCFRSWARRALFMAASVIIPIFANGIRAWSTIMVQTWTNSEFAVDFDHVFYGWIFFAIVIGLLMAAGWRFFDRGPSDPWFDPARLQDADVARKAPTQLLVLAAAGVALVAAPIAWAGNVAASARTPVVASPLPHVPGWARVAGQGGRPWSPHFAGADRIQVGRYRSSDGQLVDLAIVYYARQDEGREIVGFGQGPIGPDSAWAWAATGPAPPGGRLDRIVSFGTIREVATFYRVGKIVTGSDARVKMETVRSRLLGGPQRAVAVMVSAQQPAEGVSPRPAIDAFLSAVGPIDQLADGAAGGL